MKRIKAIVAAVLSVLVMNGCQPTYYDDGAVTLFMVDEDGYGVGGIPYDCYQGNLKTYSGSTKYNGEFTFYEGEECLFDFYGFNGNDPYDLLWNDYLYIVDDSDGGKNGIPYECQYFGAGYTYDDGNWDGSFDYDENDQCVFFL